MHGCTSWGSFTQRVQNNNIDVNNRCLWSIMFLGLLSQGVTVLQPLLHSKYDKHRGWRRSGTMHLCTMCLYNNLYSIPVTFIKYLVRCDRRLSYTVLWRWSPLKEGLVAITAIYCLVVTQALANPTRPRSLLYGQGYVADI